MGFADLELNHDLIQLNFKLLKEHLEETSLTYRGWEGGRAPAL